RVVGFRGGAQRVRRRHRPAAPRAPPAEPDRGHETGEVVATLRPVLAGRRHRGGEPGSITVSCSTNGVINRSTEPHGRRQQRVDDARLRWFRRVPRCYARTNIVACDWQRLVRFYIDVFGCRLIGPERDRGGDWLTAATGVPDARLRGQHLLLP